MGWIVERFPSRDPQSFEAERIHIYPVDSRGRTKHWTAAHGVCWCMPAVKQVCPEADDLGNCRPGCWKCDGEHLVEPWNEENTFLIIHNVETKPCYPEMPDNQLGAK